MVIGIGTQDVVIKLKCILLAICLPQQVRVVERDVYILRIEFERFFQIFFCGFGVV